MRRGSGGHLCTLSHKSMQKARATLEDFALSVMPFHSLSTRDFLCFMDVLYFVEASLYEMDELCEELLENAGGAAGGGSALTAALQSNQVLRSCIEFLQERQLFDERVQEQFELGLEYWALERELCSHAAFSEPGIAMTPDKAEMMVQKANRAISLKSFDYRVLPLLLYPLTGRSKLANTAAQEALTAWLSVYMQLVEIEDDLKDYHKDVRRNSFNLYRMYVRAYGARAPAQIRAFIAQLEVKYLHLRKQAELPLPLLAQHIKRNEEQCGAGPVMAPINGSWAVPEPVLDEGKFRALAAACGAGSPPVFIVS